MENDLLNYLASAHGTGQRYRIVLPVSKRMLVLREIHGGAADYFGVNKMLEKL